MVPEPADDPIRRVAETLMPDMAAPDRRVAETLIPAGESAGSAGSETRMPDAVAPGDAVPAGRPRYQFLRLHAEGGLGKVWIVRDADLNREVALKEVRPEWADRPDSIRRFLREAQVTGQLEHPNIVPVYELARRKEDGQPFYTMKLLRGRSLRHEVADHHRAIGEPDPLGRQKLLGAFVAVCQAVGYAHSRGVIHRDLKPENVVIGGFGEVVVLDWGLAKLIGRPDPDPDPDPDPGHDVPRGWAEEAPELVLGPEASLTTRGSVGTPAYMAPEQVEGTPEAVDERSDIYGLGAILFEILTGRPPAEGSNLAEVYRQILHGPSPSPRALAPATPRPLDAIALKALARRPEGRYARAVDLADDVQRFMAGEPVSAWREPWTVRARRWMARHRVLVTSTTAAALVAVLAGGIALASSRARAIGLVEGLSSAQISRVPEIVDQIGGLRSWANPRLRATFAVSGDDSAEKLRAGLGLLPVDPAPLDFLLGRMLRSDAETVGVVREALGRGHRAEVARRLVVDLPRLGDDARFAAHCALALYEPVGPAPEADRGWLVARLMILNRRDPVSVGAWAGLLEPILPRLVPDLLAAYIDPARDAAEHGLCARLLASAARRPEDLAAMVQVAEPRDFPAFFARVEQDPGPVIPLLVLASARDAPGIADPDSRARRRALAAVALERLGRRETAWTLLRHVPDPSARWWLVDRLGPLGSGPEALIDRIATEADPSARRALILALGNFDEARFPASRRAVFALGLVERYRLDPDAGVHSASAWLLRRWKLDGPLRQVDRDLAGKPPGDRGWFVSPSGITFAIVRGPVTFNMGPPKEEGGHAEEHRLDRHARTIGRSFAIATREVSVADYKAFLTEHEEVLDGGPRYSTDFSPEEDCPINAVSWFQAAEFCRWLGEREGIAADQECYPPVAELLRASSDAQGLRTIPADCLSRIGYRLPTDAEWEYSCRAGSETSRPFGDGDGLLGRYAWFADNSGYRTHPAGGLWPNDLGLFDVLGNINEWCHDPLARKLEPAGPTFDTHLTDPILGNDQHTLRGGAFLNTSGFARSAHRSSYTVAGRQYSSGFRLARTLP